MLVLPSSNGELALRSGQVDVAGLSTIFRDKARARGGLRLVFSDYQLFGSFNAGSMVMPRRFIQEHPNTVRKYVEGVGQLRPGQVAPADIYTNQYQPATLALAP